MIGLGHPEPGKYDERTLRLLEEVGVYLGAAIDNALLYQEVLDLKKNQSRLLAKLISAQEEERKALAAELHDDTIQPALQQQLGLPSRMTRSRSG